jgi:hypothetical protein
VTCEGSARQIAGVSAQLWKRYSGKSLDIKALKGRDPWLRLRVGDYRILYRAFTPPSKGVSARRGYLVARIVNRRDLDRASASL